MTITDNGWTLLDWDKETGRTIWGYADGDKQHYRIDYPVEKLIDANAEARNSAPTDWKGDYHRIASIPQNILYDENLGLNKAWQEGNEAYFRRWLNSSDNRAWRTRDGQV